MRPTHARRRFGSNRPRRAANPAALHRAAPAPSLGESCQSLEPRLLFASPTLAVLPNVTVLSGAPLQVPLDGNDADTADALTFTATSSNPNVVPTISPSTDRSLKIVVNHASSGAGDTAISNETMIIKLFEDKAPKTTARIIALANSGFYNGLTFHRVINDFMIQGGDPLGDGTGGSGVQFDDEFDPSLQFTGPGLIAMAKSNDDTDDSQFFITESNPRYLDFQHTIFGQLVEGESTRQEASNVLTNPANDKPLTPVTMTSVTVIPDIQNGVLSLAVPNNITSGTATITVTAKDPAGHTTTRTFTVTIGPDTNNDNPFLGPIADGSTTANTPTSVSIPTIDVDGGQQFFATAGDPNANVHYDLDFTSGVKVIVTPSNNFAGVVPLTVGVAPDSAGSSFDIQSVPVFITPAAPTSIDLLDASDTGVSSTDNLTRLNNANASAKLQFLISGVLAGAQVQLFDGATLLGTATVPAASTSVTLTTNGSASLSNGVHNLKAVQTLKNYAWTVGNRSGTLDLASVASSTQAITIDTVAPTLVGAATFDFKSATQSLSYSFSENVSASLLASDLGLVRVDDHVTTPAASIQVSYTPASNKATFTFPGYSGGMLPNGNYTATIKAGDVTDAAGNPLPADAVLSFWFLAGDIDRDRSVGFTDLVTLAQNYGKPAMTYDKGDLDGDGSVGFADLVLLAQNYGKSIPAPAPVPAADPVPAAASGPAADPAPAQTIETVNPPIAAAAVTAAVVSTPPIAAPAVATPLPPPPTVKPKPKTNPNATLFSTTAIPRPTPHKPIKRIRPGGLPL